MSESSDEQATMQHNWVCGSEDCQKNGQFYCNDCHRPLCEQCRHAHLRSPDTKIHEIVPYRHRKLQLPEEKCKLHPTRNIDIFCKECHIPLCSKCSTTKEHCGHSFDDLEEMYAEKYSLQQSEFAKLQTYFLPSTQSLKTDIKGDVSEIKNVMESIRKFMKAEAECLKNLVDEVTSESMENTYTMETSLLQMLESQETTYDDYIAYLEKMNEEFQNHLSLTNQNLLFSKTLKIQPIPETTQPVPPVFKRGQFSKINVIRLLGIVYVPERSQKRKIINRIDGIFKETQFTEKQTEQSREKSDFKPPLSLSSDVTKIRSSSIPGVDTATHVSVGKSGRLWVSDGWGNLVEADLKGNHLQEILTSGGDESYHAVTQDGNLIYRNKNKKVICKITPDRIITEFIKTGDWTPFSVHSSRINGDILVSMRKDKDTKLTRYSKTGKEIQTIQRDQKGHELYCNPRYITENINGDICASDIGKLSIVVVNRSGQHRFSYTGRDLGFHPYGICTDVLGHILVCDWRSNTVHMLDKDGRFLTALRLGSHPRGVCVDDENNLYVGETEPCAVTVYKYLK